VRETIVRLVTEAGFPAWIVPNYWFMLTLAIVIGSTTALAAARRTKSDAPVSDLLFFGIPGLFVGAKLFYGLQYWSFWSMRNVLQPAGFSLYGGLFGLLVTWLVYYRIRRFSFRAFLDCIAPALAIGLFVGRIGCFLAGCNGGAVSGLPWAVRFPPGTSSFESQVAVGYIPAEAAEALPAHPTQIYESLFGLVTFFLLWRILRSRRWAGEVFITGMIWYSAYRFPSEWLRIDGGGYRPLGIFTFSQFVALLVLTSALICYFYFSKGGGTEQTAGVEK